MEVGILSCVDTSLLALAFHISVDLDSIVPRESVSAFFGHDWNGHVWNQKVISNIISLVPAKQEECGFTGDISQEALEAWMWGFIRDARGSWCQSQPRVHFSGSRMETPDEARARTTQYTAQRGQRVKVTSHKHHKYRKRKEGVKLLLEHPSDSHTTLEWQRTQNLLNELPAEAMSPEYSDEEGTFGDNRPLIIHIPDFRRRCITTAMKRLDKAIRSHAPQLPGDKAQRHSIRQRERLHVRLTPHVRGGLEVRDKIIPLFDRWAAVHNEGHSTTEEEMDHGEGMDADN
ncbi:hypothetical protein L218DRAFT_951223 [Marasmius fiardii PR-910]|nr:hypothetical protein L218DRAFT_951223 [Marasmius fiardii PR-910]